MPVTPTLPYYIPSYSCITTHYCTAFDLTGAGLPTPLGLHYHAICWILPRLFGDRYIAVLDVLRFAVAAR